MFRDFRAVDEEQRKRSEVRYRSVLLEAVQDAVYLSAQNQQLQADNRRLRKGQCVSPVHTLRLNVMGISRDDSCATKLLSFIAALAEIEDALTERRNLKTELLPQK